MIYDYCASLQDHQPGQSVPLWLIGTFDVAVVVACVLSPWPASSYVPYERFPSHSVPRESLIDDISIHDPAEWTIFCLSLVSPALLSRFNAKGNVDASSISKTECRSSRRFLIISRSSLGRSVWSSLRQRQMSFRTDLISLKTVIDVRHRELH
jgi:hypothetical protein